MLPGLGKLGLGLPGCELVIQEVVLVVGDTVKPVGPDSEGPIDAWEAKHREAGDDLGDLCARRGHVSILSVPEEWGELQLCPDQFAREVVF